MKRTFVPVKAALFVLALLAFGCATPSAPAANTFDVKAYGATGDGTTKDTAAVQKAFDACAAAGGGVVTVSPGNYLIGSVVMGANTTLQLTDGATLTGSPDVADYPLEQGRYEGEFVPVHRALISADHADHIAILGPGSLVGPPLAVANLRKPRGPVMIELTECNGVDLENFTEHYQRLWSIHPLFCTNVVARNLTIRTTLANGDGIDIDSSQNVLIDHCDINTGDDAISIKSGRGLSAVKLDRPTQNVVIKDSSLISSIFAGIGIGTEMSGGLRNLTISNCTIGGRQNAIFIKSRDGRGGYIENVVGENLIIAPSPTFLGIDLMKKGIQAVDPVTGTPDKWARVHNISFTNVTVNNVRQLVSGPNISSERPWDGLVLSNITGTCGRGITLANVVNAQFSGINVTGYNGPLLNLTNVTGTGLDEPPANPPANPPATSAGP